jgi:hypothetical protein
MTNPNAYTLWCKGGRIGTFRSREKAEEWLERIADNPREYLHIQEWTPEPSHLPFVNFDGEDEE